MDAIGRCAASDAAERLPALLVGRSSVPSVGSNGWVNDDMSD